MLDYSGTLRPNRLRQRLSSRPPHHAQFAVVCPQCSARMIFRRSAAGCSGDSFQSWAKAASLSADSCWPRASGRHTPQRIPARAPAIVSSCLYDSLLRLEAESSLGGAVHVKDFMPQTLRDLEQRAKCDGLIGLPTGHLGGTETTPRNCCWFIRWIAA